VAAQVKIPNPLTSKRKADRIAGRGVEDLALVQASPAGANRVTSASIALDRSTSREA
jgi:hypothetical protein